MLRYAAEIEAMGHTVTSRWIKGGHQVSEVALLGDDQYIGIRFASEDWDDLEGADLMLCFTEPARSSPNRGGRHVEYGLALGEGMPIYIVGPRENVFHALADRRFDTWAEAKEALL
jgi:anaerobic selenocysteine-containing dehydrogenase